MKANQFINRTNDDAVSPVIAVILMVAITVVLAATVYVWVSGFGSNSNQPAKSLAFTSGGNLQTAQDLGGATAGSTDSYKGYIVSAASPGLKYSDLTFTLNGAPLSMSEGDCDATLTDLMDATSTPTAARGWLACSASFSGAAAPRTGDDLVRAGDHFYVFVDAASLSGQTFRVLDSAANAIVTTLTVS